MWTSETIERSKAVEALTALRSEWEDAADGKPLELVYASVGLLLDDVCQAFSIDVEELQNQVMVV